MVFFVLHNILFPVAKLANQHLLLDEFYRVQWKFNEQQQNVSSWIESYRRANQTQAQTQTNLHEQAQIISTHTILFGMSLVNFALSYRSLNNLHRRKDHRGYLANLILTLLVSLSGYLYMANTIESVRRAPSHKTSSSHLLHCIHAAILLILLGCSQWSQFVVGSVSDTLLVRVGLRDQGEAKSSTVYQSMNQFVTQLMLGSFSVAFMGLSMAEIFINLEWLPLINSRIGYTNIVLLMAILATLLELICFRLLTVGRRRSEQHQHHQQGQRNQQPRIVTSISLNDDCERDSGRLNYDQEANKDQPGSKSIDHCQSLPPIVWSISAKNTRKNSETTHSTDDDEFDNSTLSYETCLEFQLSSEAKFKEANQKQQSDDIELFDRTKYSLYDEYEYHIEDAGQPQPMSKMSNKQMVKLTDFAFQQQQQRESSPSELKESHFSGIFETLLVGDWPFVWQFLALVLLGTVYQANQLCYFSEYINYLLFKSPWKFRLALLVGVGPLVRPHSSTHHSQSATYEPSNLDSIWVCMICISVLAQNTARIIGLHYASSIHLSLGTRRLFWLLLGLSSTVPLQFVGNYYLVEYATLDPQYTLLTLETRTIIIVSHILFIQLLIGLVGALVDVLINELALQYAQHLRSAHRMQQQAARSNLSPDRSAGSIQCTVHGSLYGGFLFLGTATMSAIRILADNASRESLREPDDTASLMIVFIAFAPMIVLLLFAVLLGFHKWTLVRSLSLEIK